MLTLSCGGDRSSSNTNNSVTSSSSSSDYPLNVVPEPAPSTSKIPRIASTWHIQLNTGSNALNESYNVTMYEIDLFDSTVELIARLKANGAIVICYMNGGAYENWREDALLFPAAVLGNDLAGWEGEKWLDIRSAELKPIIQARLDLAVSKGCDGVDADNVDGYSNETGFDISYDDQLAYNRYIANEARKKDLSVGLKNDVGQIADLVNYFDFTVNEQCYQYNECNTLTPFINAGKAVFNIEYADKYISNTSNARDDLCADSNAKAFSTLVLSIQLNGDFRIACR